MAFLTGFRGARGRRVVTAGLIPLLCTACTMTVRSSVRDQSGRPLNDAVVFATAREQRPPPPRGRRTAVVVVEDLGFRPRVLPVLAGTEVTFRNRDAIAHHLYSISPAKNFELLADAGAASAPVSFERPGVVATGCALHDRMLAYVYVLETPYFARTGPDGRADLEGLPRDAYELRVWHPDMESTPGATTRHVAGSTPRSVSVDFTVPVRPGQAAAPLPRP